MSRNNLILVVNDDRFLSTWFYVFSNINADTEWNKKYAIKRIRLKITKRTNCRATALLLAHDIDKRIGTEYGVREITLYPWKR